MLVLSRYTQLGITLSFLHSDVKVSTGVHRKTWLTVQNFEVESQWNFPTHDNITLSYYVQNDLFPLKTIHWLVAVLVDCLSFYLQVIMLLTDDPQWNRSGTCTWDLIMLRSDVFNRRAKAYEKNCTCSNLLNMKSYSLKKIQQKW